MSPNNLDSEGTLYVDQKLLSSILAVKRLQVLHEPGITQATQQHQ